MSKFRLAHKNLKKYLFTEVLNAHFVAALPNLVWICDLAKLDLIIKKPIKKPLLLDIDGHKAPFYYVQVFLSSICVLPKFLLLNLFSMNYQAHEMEKVSTINPLNFP